jgi:thymidine kinase
MIKVFTGPMKSGKSEEMLREVNRKKKYAKKNVLVVKPDTDRRFSEDINKSRDNREIDCVTIPAMNPEYIYTLIDNSVQAIAIDEAQFFEKLQIVHVVQDLHDKGYEVLIAGLNMDSDRRTFSYMPELMAIADEIVLLKAVCEFCGSENATYSYADFDKQKEIVIGDEIYKACCHKCYLKRNGKV